MAAVTISIPQRCDAGILSNFDNEYNTVLEVTIFRSRMLWLYWQPRLLEAPLPMARRALKQLLSAPNCLSIQRRKNGSTKKQSHLVRRRRLRVSNGRTITKTRNNNKICTMLIRPLSIDRLETDWMARLIHWENTLLRAQTAAGYFSTLGGGYFMCHHFSTAVQLAQQQQRMALRLNDMAMYYKCVINQAYNYIHAGRFETAIESIVVVEQAVQQSHVIESDVLWQMCQAARLFAQRVRQAAFVSPTLLSSTTAATTAAPPSKTVDDYARVRLVPDESTGHDLERIALIVAET